jgi:N-acetylglucosaminyldiphosphoundecaprenol N-acetyl-beta-D-mannosaminyltransferase
MLSDSTPTAVARNWPLAERIRHIETASVLDVPIHCLRMREVVRLATDAIERGEALRIGVVNASKMVTMREDTELDADVRSSDLILADGMSIVWASRLTGNGLPERVAGIDLMLELLQACNTLRRSVFFFGATDAVLQKVLERVEREHPNLIVAGQRNGYFSRDDEADIALQISSARPDVLLVAISSPIKERFMARWGKQLNATVIHGVGGSFDVYAGKTERAPHWMQHWGLEWLFRVLQEPRRMWKRYLVTNTKFVLSFCSSLFFDKRRVRPSQL